MIQVLIQQPTSKIYTWLKVEMWLLPIYIYVPACERYHTSMYHMVIYPMVLYFMVTCHIVAYITGNTHLLQGNVYGGTCVSSRLSYSFVCSICL